MQNESPSPLSRHELARLTNRYSQSGHDAPGNQSSYLAHRQCLLQYQQQAFESLAAQWQDVPSVALTLTFRRLNKQSARRRWPDFQHDYRGPFHPHRQEGRKAIVGNMHKVFSHWAYGKAARRFKKRLGIVTVWEGLHRDHAHCHILMEIPEHWRANDEHAMLAGHDQHMRPFLDCHPALGEFVLEPTWNSAGWLDYMLKLNDKADLMQAIEWDQCHQPSNAALSAGRSKKQQNACL